ncbi:hypothetical protein OKA05_15725 [Luteolibacter arcticus]|uniref:Uncharacterized protein n=1 Tax=Luteolibacter arcticus TaxID=1581411 RepID=A0ABT3GKJ0_9BACT|nr:hypothetical protein [Luteolibacter arcticus]MCW1924017.1 hypothetical protein [Luteolibacter arcticus]
MTALKLLLLTPLLCFALRAEETQLFYVPTHTQLTGIIVKQAPEGESSPAGQAKPSWILRLPRPVTVNPKKGRETEILERDVSEVRLAGDDRLIAAAAETKSSVTCYGTLSRTAEAGGRPVIALEMGAFKVAAPPTREIRSSPDGKMFVAWVDHDLGPPLGEIRSIFLRYAIDQDTLFSVVSSPRDTQAAWNPSSSRCVIADAPDNGGPRTWLAVHKSPDEWEWQTRLIEPFRELEKKFRESDPEVHQLFRPSFLKIEWLSNTKVRFRAYCNTGTYFLTLDTDRPDEPPVEEKLSDKFLKE